jgi:hypothetical protein
MEDCHFDYITILQRKKKHFNLLDWTINCAYMQVQRTYHDHTHEDEHDHDKTLITQIPLECETNLDRFSRSYIKTLGQVEI